MPAEHVAGAETRPSRSRAIAVTVALVLLWGTLRLVIFEVSVLPLAYAVALLVHVWTRDRVLLWAMAATFAAFHTAKIFWLLPLGVFTPDEAWANYGATLANIAVAGTAVHLIIVLRTRLERALAELRAHSEELATQNEELATQAEELANQTEELTQQSEELANQNEELQSQSEEIAGLVEALERREKLLQTLLDTTRQSGSEHTALGHIAAAAADLLGADTALAVVYEETGQGLTIRAAHPGERAAADGLSAGATAADDFVALALAEQRTASIRDLALRPDLHVLPVLGAAARAVLCTPIQVGGTAFGAFVVYSTRVRDWTDEDFRLAEWLADQCGRMLQALRVQSELRDADRRKSEFLATLSHELRNPLAAIKFALELVGASQGRDAEAIRVMQRQLRQLVRLVDDLLDATRLSSSKVQIRKARVDLAQIVRQALEAAEPEIAGAGHELTVQLPQTPVWLDADADRLDQVVANLLSNAVRYTHGGGRVSVSLSAGGGEACLSVLDNGIGLERGDLERVFEMFMQVNGPGSGGLGIGLALVRGIVELHGGRVEARSVGLGGGSEFRVTLPLAVGAPTAAHPTVEEIAGNGNGSAYRVLVVDDNADSADMIGALLEVHGHAVRVAYDADAALAAARDFVPDAALLDIGLPGTDGYQLARQLRDDRATRNMRLIALTGWGQDGDRARAQQAGFDAHLTKPAAPGAILAALGGHDASTREK